MCDANVIDWFRDNLTDDEVRGKRILEVGSRDVNGSVRPVLMAKGAREYVGIDIETGPGVDIRCDVCNLVELTGPDVFDIIVSTCCLEHVENILAAISNIKRACKPNGLIVLAVPWEWPRHDYPRDFWRFDYTDICNLFEEFISVKMREFSPKRGRRLLYAKMRKPMDFNEIRGPLPHRV